MTGFLALRGLNLVYEKYLAEYLVHTVGAQ